MEKKVGFKPIQTKFTEPTLDPEAGMEISQDEDIYMKTLSSLMETSLIPMLQSIRDAMIKGPQKEFRRAAHSLKGAASYGGCTRIQMISQALQLCAEQGNYTLGVDLFNQLIDEAQELTKEYIKFLQSKNLSTSKVEPVITVEKLSLNDVEASMKNAIVLEEAKVGERRRMPAIPKETKEEVTHPPVLKLEEEQPKPSLEIIKEVEEQRVESIDEKKEAEQPKGPEPAFSIKRSGTRQKQEETKKLSKMAPEQEQRPPVKVENPFIEEEKKEIFVKETEAKQEASQEDTSSFNFRRKHAAKTRNVEWNKVAPDQQAEKVVRKGESVPIKELPGMASNETAETFDEENDYPFDDGWKCVLI